MVRRPLDVDAICEELDLFGLAVVEQVLSAAEVQTLKRALLEAERQAGTISTHRGVASHVANLPTRDRAFFPIIDHPAVLPVLERFLGETLILGSLNARIVRPGDPRQRLHSDIPQDMLNRDSPVMMNTIWMLDDFTAENGATWCVPGSHRSGLLEPPAAHATRYAVQAIAPAGSVLIINGQTWHGGGANNGEANRDALFGHYRKDMLKFQFDPHDGFPPAWLEDLSERQKALLRMTDGAGAPHAADFYER